MVSAGLAEAPLPRSGTERKKPQTSLVLEIKMLRLPKKRKSYTHVKLSLREN